MYCDVKVPCMHHVTGTELYLRFATFDLLIDIWSLLLFLLIHTVGLCRVWVVMATCLFCNRVVTLCGGREIQEFFLSCLIACWAFVVSGYIYSGNFYGPSRVYVTFSEWLLLVVFFQFSKANISFVFILQNKKLAAPLPIRIFVAPWLHIQVQKQYM